MSSLKSSELKVQGKLSVKRSATQQQQKPCSHSFELNRSTVPSLLDKGLRGQEVDVRREAAAPPSLPLRREQFLLGLGALPQLRNAVVLEIQFESIHAD